MRERIDLDHTSFSEFVAEHRLPEQYNEAIDAWFLPLALWLERGLRQQLDEDQAGDRTLVLGINGAQGTGKSTLGEFLALACQKLFGWNPAVLSIDDFYLTRAEREALAHDRHSLLRTRGVPGTHDTALLNDTLDRLCALGAGESFAPPRFDKSIDDRAAPPWPAYEGPIGLVVLEGWCVGTPAESDEALVEPVNELERVHDANGNWRRWVNDRLRSDYALLWDRLDALVYLKAPDFDAIYRWRLEQEQKLAKKAGAEASGVMSADEVREFISYYERLTRQALARLPGSADVVLELGTDHAVRSVQYR